MVVANELRVSGEPVADYASAINGYIAQLRIQERTAPLTRAGNGTGVARFGPAIEYPAHEATRDRVRASLWARETHETHKSNGPRWAAEGR